MNKKSGNAGTLVAPIAPVKALEADVADPGKVAEIKAEQVKQKKGKYGKETVKPFKLPTTKEEKEKNLSWIEIELVGEDKKPIPGQRYQITLPGGSVAEGTLDHNGWARLVGFEKGSCKVTFPDLDQECWEFVKSLGPRKEEK